MVNTIRTHLHDKQLSMSMFIRRSQGLLSLTHRNIYLHSYTYLITHIRTCHHTHTCRNVHMHMHMSHVTTPSLVVSRCASIDTSTDRSSAGGWLLLLYSTLLYSTQCMIYSHPIPSLHTLSLLWRLPLIKHLLFHSIIFSFLSSSFRLCLPYTSLLSPLLWCDVIWCGAVWLSRIQ